MLNDDGNDGQEKKNLLCVSHCLYFASLGSLHGPNEESDVREAPLSFHVLPLLQ